MSESLVQVLARLELKVAELNDKVVKLEASKNKKQEVDFKKEIEAVVTIGYVTSLYRDK